MLVAVGCGPLPALALKNLQTGYAGEPHFAVRALPARADYVGAVMSPLPLAHNFLLMDLTVHEYAGLLRYRVYEMLGWNIEVRHPGAL
jgi:hypothetical protein